MGPGESTPQRAITAFDVLLPQARTAAEGVVTGYGCADATFVGQCAAAVVHALVSAWAAGVASTGVVEQPVRAVTASGVTSKAMRRGRVNMRPPYRRSAMMPT